MKVFTPSLKHAAAARLVHRVATGCTTIVPRTVLVKSTVAVTERHSFDLLCLTPAAFTFRLFHF